MLRGRILAESLRPGAVLDVPDLRIVRMWREDVSATAGPGQPPVWTLIDVTAPDERAGELADALSAVLLAEGGWYADFTVGDDHVVIFAGRSFRYRRGDEPARAHVVAYGRSVGVPEHQLDRGA
ncbi:MAG TPA: hypothetical protein VKZ81_08210 [Pseudonocardia sp.]|jgi:hypothetical protein|uniref:hypothetical protein n=1 Tax=Pseudonocardia sp. TaxID=60912 RepID=UPI002B4B3A9E|nr:hypothetical protein [Pseudonocardia sp.]HLU55432.1 hypothetical protein [Pseudonocardia sp.]